MRTSERCAYNHDRAACRGGRVEVLSKSAQEIRIFVKAGKKANTKLIAEEFICKTKENCAIFVEKNCKHILGDSLNFKDLDADYSGDGHWECIFSAKMQD